MAPTSLMTDRPAPAPAQPAPPYQRVRPLQPRLHWRLRRAYVSCCDSHGQPLDAVEEVRPEAIRGAGRLEAVEVRDHLLEPDSYLQTGEVGAQAEVRAAEPEREMPVGGARHVEAIGVGEAALVEV